LTRRNQICNSKITLQQSPKTIAFTEIFLTTKEGSNKEGRKEGKEEKQKMNSLFKDTKSE